MKQGKIDFKKCPFCGSEKVQALKSHPDYDCNGVSGSRVYELRKNHWLRSMEFRVGDEYHEPCDCGDCGKDWVTIYKPFRNQSDALTALESINGGGKQ